MKKHSVTLALISSAFFMNNSYCCPCNASTTDKRPFFEQYESAENSTEKKEKIEPTNNTTQTEQS